MLLKTFPFTIQVFHEPLLKEHITCIHHYERLMKYLKLEGERLGVWFCKDETLFHFDG